MLIRVEIKQGWKFNHWFLMNHSFFVIKRSKNWFDQEKDWIAPIDFFKDQRDQFPNCPSLIHSWSISKINESKSISSIFKNIEEQRSKGAIHSFGIKGRETEKTYKNIFFDQITLFCNQRLKDRFDHQKDWIALWNLFQRSTRPVCSQSIFLKDYESDSITVNLF